MAKGEALVKTGGAALTKLTVEKLTEDDMIASAAYLASLAL